MPTLTEEQELLRQQVLNDFAELGVPADVTLSRTDMSRRDRRVVREALDAQVNGVRP